MNNSFPKEVVCINDNWGDLRYIHLLPKKGQIYTAESIYNKHYFLKEFITPIRTTYLRPCFQVAYFADLDDIQITELTEILKEEPQYA